MPFKGVLKQSTAFVLDVTTGSLNTGPTSVTITTITRDRVSNVDLLTVVAGATTRFNGTIGNNVGRILVEVNPPGNGTADVLLSQGAALFQDGNTGDQTYVYDVIV